VAKPSEKVAKPDELKRIGDYVKTGGERLDGEKVDIDSILGDDIILKDFVFVESTKFATEEKKTSEFAIIQFARPEAKDKVLTTSCGGAVVVRALKEMPKNYLPVVIRITRVKSTKGTGRYYNIE